MNNTIIEIIKGMLAPAIMISACGLLLLGMNNKYSLIVNRIRTLNDEFRHLKETDTDRRDCIVSQLPMLIERMKIVRNVVWLYTIAIAMFIFAIFIIGLSLILEHSFALTIIAFVFFIIAFIAVLVGVLFAAKEVRLGYRILRIETRNVIYYDD